MRTATLFAILGALIGMALAHHGTAGVYRNAATNPSYLAGKLHDFKLRKPYLVGLENVLDNILHIKVPAAGTPWSLWEISQYQTGTSFFNVGNHTSTQIIPGLPYVQAIDPISKVFYNENPLAGQFTDNVNGSYIWFDFDLGTGPQTVCFVNKTATFDNQLLAHSTVVYTGLNSLVPVQQRIGRSNFTFTEYVATAGAGGIGDDFGGGNYADMSFWGSFRLSNLRPINWCFAQPAVTGKKVPGPQTCDHNTGVVGGCYDNTGVDDQSLPFSAAPAGVVRPHAACYNGGDITKGISAFLPDFNTFLCAN